MNSQLISVQKVKQKKNCLILLTENEGILEYNLKTKGIKKNIQIPFELAPNLNIQMKKLNLDNMESILILRNESGILLVNLREQSLRLLKRIEQQNFEKNNQQMILN